jgi:hypothetical protein
MIKLEGVADDLGREAVAGVGGGLWHHPASLAEPGHSDQRRPSWQCRLYETAVLATLRDRLRSADIWVVGTRDHQAFESNLLPAEAAGVASAPVMSAAAVLPRLT